MEVKILNVKNKFKNKNFKIVLIFGIFLFIIEAVYGVYLSYYQGILLNDAFSRTANAFYVVFVKPARYSSIGLVWNPLPSTFQIPFMFLARIWRPIASGGIAAAITTAAFAALSSCIIYDTLLKYKISKGYSFFITILYSINPFIFFYGCNGMSEAFSFFFMIYCICKMGLWFRSGKSKHIIEIGFALAGLFFSRYEAIPFAAALGVCMGLNILFNRKENKYIIAENKSKEKFYYMEGTFILIFTPIAYAVVLWILFNFIISGNPLYFLNSVYSNVSQSTFAEVSGSLFQVFLYSMKRALPFLPVTFAIIILRIAQKKLFKYDFLSFIMFVLFMLGFHYIMLLKGNSFGWLRFFAYSLPISAAWIPYELYICDKKYLKFAKSLFAVSLIVSGAFCYWALNDDDLAKEEKYARLTQETYVIADYINKNINYEDRILLDVFTLSGVMLNIENTDNLVVSSSLDFEECVEDPVHNNIDYILVPSPNGIGNLDAINIVYKDLYENGTDWCVEEMAFNGFKLFRVIN